MTQSFENFQGTISSCHFPGLEFEVGEDFPNVVTDPELRCYWLRVIAREGSPFAFCTQTGEPMEWNGRKHRLSIHMTETELVRTAFFAVLVAMEHEARERFTFEEVPVMDSHLSVRALVEFASDPSRVDRRSDVN